MTDEKKSETEVTQEDLQLDYDELLEEFNNKNEEIEKLKEDLERQEAETQEYISLSQRLQADFENFKKITDKQNKEIIKFANENIIKEFLDCYEDFGRALEVENDENLREGIELTYNKFKDIMKTKHEIANECVYSATMALADAITEDIRELTKDGGEVEIYPNYYEYGEEHDDCWLASMNNDKVYLTKCGSLITKRPAFATHLKAPLGRSISI